MSELEPVEPKLVNPVASIVAGPSTNGFVVGGRDVRFSEDVWRDQVKFEAGPCDSPFPYPNKSADCLDLIDSDIIDAADPKDEHELIIDGPFFPWTVVENIVCNTSDVVKERHLELASARIDQVRSSQYAQEFSTGTYSGSPSLKGNATPITNTAYTLTQALARLIDARIEAGAPGPHVFHLPIALEPIASNLLLSSTNDYRFVFDNYAKSYIPATDKVGGGAATAPGATEAWVGVTGPYEYSFAPTTVDPVKTIDSRTRNKAFIQAEQKLWFRFETCNTFLAKVTVF